MDHDSLTSTLVSNSSNTVSPTSGQGFNLNQFGSNWKESVHHAIAKDHNEYKKIGYRVNAN